MFILRFLEKVANTRIPVLNNLAEILVDNVPIDT